MVGLVGGVASGKSTVAGLLRGLGAEVIDADRLAHDALEDPEVRRRVVEAFGGGILGENGRIDRKRLAEAAFRSAEELRRLEGLVHPWVLSRMERTLDGWARRGPPPAMAVLDVVLLLESGADRLCDSILYVRAPRRARAARACRDRAWDRGEVARRERFQRPLTAKATVADEVIENDGSLGETERQVRAVFRRLLRAYRGGPARKRAVRRPPSRGRARPRP